MNLVSLNGNFLPAGEPALLVSNRGYRYGDGLFETMKLVNGRLPLAPFHFERLLNSLAFMKFIIPVSFTPEKIRNEIISLAEENQCSELARVRVSVFRGNGDLFETYGEMEYTIECNTIGKQGNQFNRDGLEIGTYSEHRKATGSFSNLKSANFHPYSLAALFAKENQWDDCLVLNSSGNITDTTIANLFVIQGDSISTPSLEEGCVNGVMRGYLLRELKTAGYMVRETSIAPPALENAEACFLTNAVRGISWVKKYGTKTFDPGKPAEIYDRFIKPLFGKPK